MKKLGSKLILILVLVMIFSFGIDMVYRNIYQVQYVLPKNLWIFPEIPVKYELVLVGNSHAEEGITFDRYNIHHLSLASAAQSFEYDIANLTMYSRQIKEGAVIIINVSPVSFPQGKPDRNDALQTQYYDGRLSPFLIPHLKIEDYLQSQIFPFLRAGYSWRSAYNDQIVKRLSVEQKWKDAPSPTPTPTVTPIPEKTTIVVKKQSFTTPSPTPTPIIVDTYKPITDVNKEYFYQVKAIEYELTNPLPATESMLVDSMNFIFHKWYNSKGLGPEFYDTNRIDLEKLIAYCLRNKWRPVLVTVPISDVLHEGLLDDFLQKNLHENIEKTNLQGSKYFDYSQYKPITENRYLFSDSDHLNKKGAVIFSYILLRRLIEEGLLPPSTDNYDYTFNPPDTNSPQ